MIDDELTGSIIESAIEVHRNLGPGLFETTYRLCLCHELTTRGLRFAVESKVELSYKGHTIGSGYRADVIVAGQVIVEVKHVEKILSLHEAQLRTYLKLSQLRTGLLLNFNSTVMKNGIRRLQYPSFSHVPSPPSSPNPLG